MVLFSVLVVVVEDTKSLGELDPPLGFPVAAVH